MEPPHDPVRTVENPTRPPLPPTDEKRKAPPGTGGALRASQTDAPAETVLVMGKTYDRIDDRIRDFIAAQRMFFVATAPTATDGHINVSPKGLAGTWAVVDEETVAYLDLTGSGIETIAHLRDNGRICLMFCAFEGPPRIVRIHGFGEVHLPSSPAFQQLRSYFGDKVGIRSIIRVRAQRISDSCGYGVPRYAFEADRDQLVRWAEKKGPEGLTDYRKNRNAESIDGLDGLKGFDVSPRE